MPYARGSRFREDYDKIATIESPFKEEIIRINEELKHLNLERDKFNKQLFGGIKGVLYRNVSIILKKEDLSSKYKLTNFFKQLKKQENEYKYFQAYNFRKDVNKIDLPQINAFYDSFEDRLFATTCFLEMIATYKNSNFEINNLYQKNNYQSPFVFEHILFGSTDELFMYIENPQIKEIGKKMYDEYIDKKEKTDKINEKITELENSIQNKISSVSFEKLSLDQLSQYKDVLQSVNDLLSMKDEDSINNNRQK